MSSPNNDTTSRDRPPSEFKRGSRKWQRAKQRERLNAIRERAVRAGLVSEGLNPIMVLQRLIDDAFIDYANEYYEYQQATVPLPTTENPDPKPKPFSTTRLRQLRREAAYFAQLALQYNIADRRTRQLEMRTQLLASLLRNVLRHPDINLPESKVRLIPMLLQEEADKLQISIQRGYAAPTGAPAGTISVPPSNSMPPHRLAA